MKKVILAAGALLIALALLVLVTGRRERQADVDRGANIEVPDPSPGSSPAADPRSFLYGRLTTTDGATYEGRLRFGGEEAFWGDYFHGFKDENPWAAHVPPDQLEEHRPIEIFGFRIANPKRPIDLGRPFVARFGDIARIEADGLRLRVTLKSGSVFDLERMNADDLGDGVRVWDETRGVLNVGDWRIGSIELFPATHRSDPLPGRLHGTMLTRQGDFTGFVQWDRRASVGTDELHGQTADGPRSLRFDLIRSVERRSEDGLRLTLADGSEIELSSSGRGTYVDDQRYGRVLISPDAFERLDFSPAGSGPAYDDFPPGQPLTGSVTTRTGRRLVGRLVYDLDESETTETLDAPSGGVNYTIPFGRVASIVYPAAEENDRRVAVYLHGGEELQLESRGDLAGGSAGMLVFGEAGDHPDYVRWPDVERIDFDRPSATFPPLAEGDNAAPNAVRPYP